MLNMYLELSFFVMMIFSSIIGWEFIIADAPKLTRIWGIVVAACLIFLAWPIMLGRLTSPRYIKEYVARCSARKEQHDV